MGKTQPLWPKPRACDDDDDDDDDDERERHHGLKSWDENGTKGAGQAANATSRKKAKMRDITHMQRFSTAMCGHTSIEERRRATFSPHKQVSQALNPR